MVGLTLKLGFDSTAVGRGLGSVGKQIGNFSKQIGIGAARQVGTKMTDWLGRALQSIPESFSEFTTWAGDLADLQNQTGISVDKLIQLQEAFRLAGTDSVDTGRMISGLASTLQKAASEGGPAADALKRIGLNAGTLANMPIDKAFESIAGAVAGLNKVTKTPITFNDPLSKKFGTSIVETVDKFDGLESVLESIFGGRVGYKMIRFFKTFDDSMGKAAHNTQHLKRILDGDIINRVDDMGDSWGRFSIMFKEFMGIGFRNATRFPMNSMMNNLQDMLSPGQIQPVMDQIGNLVGRNMEVALTQNIGQSFGDMFSNFGRKLGEGFLSMVNLKSMIFGPEVTPKSSASAMITAPQLEQTNALLRDIRKEAFVSRLARFG